MFVTAAFIVILIVMRLVDVLPPLSTTAKSRGRFVTAIRHYYFTINGL